MSNYGFHGLALPGLAALAAACAGDIASGEGGFAGSLRDSPGIRIVENAREGLWSDDGGWTTELVLTI